MRRATAAHGRKFHPCLKVLLCFLLFALCLAGCKTSHKGSPALSGQHEYLSCKVKLTIPTHGGAVYTATGTLKMVAGERLQLSFLMPILRSEVARVEVTPNDVLLVDRMGKRYVKATRRELRGVLPKKAGFATLEKALFAAAQGGKPQTLSGADLGITSLKKGEITLSNFNFDAVKLTPAKLSSKYKEVSLKELLSMLMSL
ncbi:MAG: DUF4292 domain-containing protein [Prevotellaceae bacterium]|nr:DUF4292 domain-containing protein [Prevotellaceae bacterium]